MPDLTGVSGVNRQTVIPLATFTAGQMQVIIPAIPTATPRKIGYAWIIALPTASPSCRRVIGSGPVYAPGTLFNFPTNFGFSGTTYGLIVEWNENNLSWLARYS